MAGIREYLDCCDLLARRSKSGRTGGRVSQEDRSKFNGISIVATVRLASRGHWPEDQYLCGPGPWLPYLLLRGDTEYYHFISLPFMASTVRS
jgi:hypothetical protein